MRGARAAALLLLAASARAEVAVFDAGRLPPDGALYSADGYHYAYLVSDEKHDRWLVDGKARATGAAGTLSPAAALSADGSVLMHFVAAGDGWALAFNGRRAGKKTYEDVASPALSPAGRNMAFAAKTPAGWVTVSGQGTGPAFPKPPSLLLVSEKSTLALNEWAGRPWLYRDHAPVAALAGGEPAVSPDLKRTAAVVPGASGGGTYVEVDGKRLGPWADAGTPAFSPDGRHVAFLAKRRAGGPFDTLIVDGRSAEMTPCEGCTLVVDNAGRAFEDELVVAIDEKAQIHRFYLGTKPLGRPSRVGSSPRGTHYVYSALTGRGDVIALDGKAAETDAPLALPVTAPVFDGENEYHYWTNVGPDIALVCGAVSSARPKETRCAAVAAALGWPPASDAPSSAP